MVSLDTFSGNQNGFFVQFFSQYIRINHLRHQNYKKRTYRDGMLTQFIKKLNSKDKDWSFGIRKRFQGIKRQRNKNQKKNGKLFFSINASIKNMDKFERKEMIRKRPFAKNT